MSDDDLYDWLVREEDEDRAFGIDKAWHALHYVLTGAENEDGHPLSAVVLGGDEIGPDLGYGGPWLIPTESVTELSRLLSQLSETQVRESIRLEEMARLSIYPQVWDREDERDHNLNWIVDAFRTVRDGFERASTSGLALVRNIM